MTPQEHWLSFTNDHVDIGKYSDNELTQYLKINKRIKFLTKQVI